MNLLDKIESAFSILKVKFLHLRIPLAARVELTNRCPNKCQYCNIWNTQTPEPTTDEIFILLNELKNLGTKKVSFSGGEPMLRSDIGKIIDYCKSIGISPEMNTCGMFVSKRINEISSLDLIKVSLDGPKNIHDFIVQRKGSYEEAISAIEASTKCGIKTVITTTITKYNIKHFDFLINLSKKYSCFVAFQPVKNMVYSNNNVDALLPDVNDYRNAVQKLIKLKLSGDGCMRNSLAGLKHIYHWPKYKKFQCAAGKLFVIIDVDGTVYPCDRVDTKYQKKLPNWKDIGLEKAIKSLPEVVCSGCGFCGALELSFLKNLQFNALSTLSRLI